MEQIPAPFRAGWFPLWHFVWERDDPYHPGDDCYFDYRDRRLVWIGEDSQKDDEVKEAQAEVMTDPERYEEIRRLHHGEHHEIFRDWLDQEVPEEVRALCNLRSIGGFFEDVTYHFKLSKSDDIKQSWYEFKERALQHRAETWLKDRGFDVEWV